MVQLGFALLVKPLAIDESVRARADFGGDLRTDIGMGRLDLLDVFLRRAVFGLQEQVEGLDHRRLADLVGPAHDDHTVFGKLDLAVGDSAVVRQDQPVQSHAAPLRGAASLNNSASARLGVQRGILAGPGRVDQFCHGRGGEPADTEVRELTVGRHNGDITVPVPQPDPGEQPGVLVQAGVQRGPVGDGQRAGQDQLHHGPVLVRHQIQVHVEIGDVAAVVYLAAQRGEPPPADQARVDGNLAAGVLVEVDDQHVARVGLDVVVVGDFRRTRVPDPAAVTDLRAGVLVAQRDVVNRAAAQRILERRPAGSATAWWGRGRACRHRRGRRGSG